MIAENSDAGGIVQARQRAIAGWDGVRASLSQGPMDGQMCNTVNSFTGSAVRSSRRNNCEAARS
jgi:hypothetical protein